MPLPDGQRMDGRNSMDIPQLEKCIWPQNFENLFDNVHSHDKYFCEVSLKVKVNMICIAPWHELTSKALRHGIDSQEISVLPAYATLIH